MCSFRQMLTAISTQGCTCNLSNDLRMKFTFQVLQMVNYTSVVRCHDVVVCMILTTPGSWYTKARAVLDTWAKRCHIPIFFYSRHAASTSHGIVNATHSVALDVPHGRRHISRMTMAGLRYSLKTYGDIADWFLKCDDDT